MTGEGETIASVRTPPGRGGIAVVALAGPRAEGTLSEVFRSRGKHPPQEGQLQLGHIVTNGRALDEAVVCRTPQGIEINVHGGAQVLQAVLGRLSDCGASVVPAAGGEPFGLPPAHPQWGNPAVGRELLAALPAARSRRVVALLSAQWSGGISELARARPPDAGALRSAAAGLPTALRLLDPAEVVLAGPPNAGKSALANALVGRPVSVVHEMPGTTRDWVREEALMQGVPVWLTDTAGIWQATGEEDAEAVRRARQRVRQADVVLLIGAGRAEPVPSWCPAERVLRVSAKCDVCPADNQAHLAVSTATGERLDALHTATLKALGLAELDAGVPRAFTERQARLLVAAADALDAGNDAAARDRLDDLLAGKVSGTP